MWNTPVIIFDDEDESKLQQQFVELSARWPEYPNFDIAQEVFKGLRDPEARANQAALVWGNSLAIKERIRKARDNGGSEPAEMTEEEKYIRKCEAEANNPDNTGPVRFKWFELAAKMRGLIKENSEAGKEDTTTALPIIRYSRRSDATA